MKQILIGIMICSILLITGCVQEQGTSVTSSQSPTLKVGFMGPLTGDAASIGIPIKQGAQLAIEELAAKGVAIEGFYEDGGCSDGARATSAYNKLRNVNDIDVIVTVCSPELLAVAPQAGQDHVLVISPSATAASISNAGEHVFRLAPSDALQGVEGARLLSQYSKVGVLYVNHDYGVGLKETVVSELGDKVVLSETFAPGSKDMRTILTKVKSSDIDALYLAAFPKDMVVLLTQMKELGINVPMIASEAAKDPQVLGPVQGMDLTITVPSAKGVRYSAFESAYQTRFNEEPRIFSGESYDTIQVIARAFAAESQDVIAGMKTIRDHEGVAGSVTFDRKGDVSKPYDLFTVREGKFAKI